MFKKKLGLKIGIALAVLGGAYALKQGLISNPMKKTEV